MYRIFLTDTDNYVELNTEDIQIESVFSVSDIGDITAKKDTITKTITFKGTKVNNNAFGYHFLLNKHIDGDLDKHLFFNYNPSHKVDCKVFEDGLLIINGTMLLTGVDIDKGGNIVYSTIITGKVVSLKSALGDKKLEDLAFTDLKHQYTKDRIAESWGVGSLSPLTQNRTQRYNPDTDTYFFKDFAFGDGYVYPFIDYGNKFKSDEYNTSYSLVNLYNYRPAIYVKEYLNRIFKDAGYSYELKADTDFIDRFNKLIIPDDNDVFRYNTKLTKNEYKRDITFNSIDKDVNPINDAKQYVVHPLPLPVENYSDFTNYGPVFGTNDKEKTIVQFNKSVATDIKLDLTLDSVNNYTDTVIPSKIDAEVIVQVVKRSYSTDDKGLDDWDVLGEWSLELAPGSTKTNVPVSISIEETRFEVGDQICVFLKDTYWAPPSNTKDACNFTITDIDLSIATHADRLYNVNLSYGDYIIPHIPIDVKQIDFVKSILTLFNLYVYNSKDNPTHLYLQPYDEFYLESNPLYLVNSALNWTKKIDYSKGLSIASNLDLPVRYNFSFKEDKDYLNKSYKDKYGEVFGTYKVEDSSGISDEKKVDVIFSPTPTIKIPGQSRMYCFMADGGTSLLNKKPIKTNIRIIYYNGAAYSDHPIKYADDTIDNNGVPVVQERFTTKIYAQSSNYYMSIENNTNTELSTYTLEFDIHFGEPKEMYFEHNGTIDVPTSYSYYKKQIQEKINPNIATVICNASLNSTDISNLDFHKPIWIDTGEQGSSYFKLLKVTYLNSITPAKVQLEKINLIEE